MADRFDILGVPVNVTTLSEAASQIIDLAKERAEDAPAPYVCCRDVHGVVRCQTDEPYRKAHEEASLVTPDGMPVVWWGRWLGHKSLERVYGPDLCIELCKRSVEQGVTHYFYGGKEGVAAKLAKMLQADFPGLQIVGQYVPPFRPLTDEEEDRLVEEINALKPDIVWIGLGSPKQEMFMNAIAPRLRCGPLLGVGAAFDFLSGEKPQAPKWIQKSGFEWLFRLISEPRRLWRRYLVGHSVFIYLMAKELIRRRFSPAQPTG